MKNKLEQQLDSEFENLGESIRTFHFLKNIGPYTAITIVDNGIKKWETAETILEIIFERTRRQFNKNPSTRLIRTAQHEGIYGIALCDRRDQFNRQRGRTIAKGRLLKHLKKVRISNMTLTIRLIKK